MQTDTLTRFFDSFLSSSDEKITIRFLRDAGKTGTAADARAGKSGTVADLLPAIKRENKTTWGAYFVVNSTGGKPGTNDSDVQHARALFIDVDGAACPEFFPVEPSAILRRSDGGGFHVYWFLNDTPEDVADMAAWTAAQKTLIHYYKSDKTIHNPARLMRIPGTVNHKEKANGAVYELDKLTGERYDIDAVIMGHTSEDARKKAARLAIRRLFKGAKMEDGDGRHRAFVQVVFILNDYGFTGDAAKAELARANEKYNADPYTPEELEKFLSSQKYAKGAKGNKAVEKAAEEQAKIDRMTEAVKNWYYVRQQDAFFMEGSNVPVTPQGFSAKFSYLLGAVNPAKFVFLHDCIKQYESFVYDPGADTDIPTRAGIDRNMYTPPEIAPIETRPDWFLKHIEYLIPDKIERGHFLNYFAYLVQNPGKKVMHGVLIIGRQGVGKSILARVFSQIFGAANVAAPHNENLSGNFTGWAKHCQLVIINELMQVDKKDFNNKIKPFISEPEIEIREMYKAPYTIKNCMNMLAFSNHDNALYIDKDDRRWFVVKSEAAKKNAAYYDTLIDAMDNRAGEVLHFFQSRDISAFRPGAEPPTTEAKRDMVAGCMSDLEAWIVEGLESGAAPFDGDITTVEDIRDNIPRSMQGKFINAKRIARLLREHGASPVGERIRVGGVRRRFWVLRDAESWTDDAIKAKVREQYGAEEVESFGLVV